MSNCTAQVAYASTLYGGIETLPGVTQRLIGETMCMHARHSLTRDGKCCGLTGLGKHVKKRPRGYRDKMTPCVDSHNLPAVPASGRVKIGRNVFVPAHAQRHSEILHLDVMVFVVSGFNLCLFVFFLKKSNRLFSGIGTLLHTKFADVQHQNCC